MPGCPQAPDQIWNVFQAIVAGKLPPKGSVVGAEEHTLCEACTRTKKEKKVAAYRRVATEAPDPTVCFVDQGFLCLGMATRAGCGHRCHKSNMGCRGCYGPPSDVIDQGAKALSAISSVMDATSEAGAEAQAEGFEDPVRSFYRFSLPASLLRRSR
jgi:F420-non-reducing hydrogenase small subunit